MDFLGKTEHPDDPEIWFNRGVAFTADGDYVSAEKCFLRTLALAPNSLETLLNLGYVLDLQGRSEEALCRYEIVLKTSPENAKAHYNRAAHLLRSGDLINGFADYEYRFAAVAGSDNRSYSQPRWDGSPLHGRNILVYCEQGLGDALMFARYLPLLTRMGARVTLEAQQPLVSLLSGLEGIERVVPKSDIPPYSDVYIPLLSLPHVFQTILDTIPNHTPYLMPSDSLISIWKERVENNTDKMRISLSWAGKRHPYPNRSCPPEYLEQLLSLPGCQFYSLQVGEQDRFPLSQAFSEGIVDLTDMVSDFTDSAALIANLDLVITIDTAVAHLAGAMGKPVWVILPFASDWRWMLGRSDSPWYPTMRLFRQPRPGDWDAVVNEIAVALHERLSHPGGDLPDDMQERRFQAALNNIDAEPAHSIAEFADLLAQFPDDPALWFNMGRAYDVAGQPAQATSCFRQALLLDPDSASIWLRLGDVLQKRNFFAEAEACLQKAHVLSPESIDILLKLGAAQVQQGNTDEAFDCCRKMLAIDPGCVTAIYNMAYLQLRSGDYQAGFANFEVRLAMKTLKIDGRSYSQPRWDGSPLEGRSILVFGEQGLGDVIQFSRYLPLVAELGGKVILELDPPLLSLFSAFPGVYQVVPKSGTPPLTDVYVNLLSLPYLFGTTLETVPNKIPYIVPDAIKAAEWRQLLSDETAYRVGLVWRGSPRNPLDQQRSCPIAMLSPLSALPGVRFYSLQVGAGSEEITSHDAGIELVDHTGRLNDLSDTAAFIANLDLVIGVDTAVVHLAGAMGKPVWIILSFVADWRWIVGRHDSPWYPTARIFWQERRGWWGDTVYYVKDALSKWLGEKKRDYGFDDIESLYKHGSRLKEEGNLVGAERCFRQIVELAPDLPDPQHSLGVVLHLQGLVTEAVKQYRIVITLEPVFVKAHYNLANALLQLGLYQEAIVSTRATLQCDPTHADAHWLLGMLLLQSGDFLNGWQEYEWRWKAQNFKEKMPDLGRPQWDGSPLEGRCLLIHMEQGRGDMIQFIRYAPIIVATGGKIVVCAVKELTSLLESVEGVSNVASSSESLPDFDLHIPVLSLPHLSKTTIETIPSTVPYLRPDDNKTKEWCDRFPPDGRFRVGLAWQGSAIHRDDQNRSCALTEFLQLGELAGVDFYNLQLGIGAEQLLDLPVTMKVIDFSDRISDFSDTAAIIKSLDLVISVDTAVAHLAGALGKPVWVLLPFAADWRWFLEKEDSPWYPSMRLFRQNSPGDWHNVICRIRKELSKLLIDTDLLNHQGIEQLKSGRNIEAEHTFAVAIASNPDNAETHCNRGVALDALKRYEEAIESYRLALLLRPDNIQPLFNMGNACMSLDNLEGARACYERVHQLMPNFVPACLCLGEIAKSCRDYDLAHLYYKKALSVDPSCVEAFQGDAEAYQAEEEFNKAITAYQVVLTFEPERASAWNMLGTVYHSLERHEEAEACYRKALAVLPDSVTVLNNLGVELNDQGRLEDAILVYRHLLEVDNSYADGHWNLSVALLAAGEYIEGWQEYEWRFRKTNPVPRRDFLQPRWDGSDLRGRTILLHAEQGFGDTIQFARFAPLMAKRGARVIIECQVPALKRLLHSLEGVAEIVVAGEPLPPFDCHLPMMSLPLLFETTLDSIPSPNSYLAAEPGDVENWQQRLGPAKAFRVGLVWFAKQGQVLNRKRSCRLEMFAPILAVPGVEFFSLQIGLGVEQLAEYEAGSSIIDLTSHITDFADTAGFIANIDLVITIDTAVAHLAGALGARTLVLLPYVAEWRWLCQRQDSPWYPSIRLFRQPVAGDWPALMASVSEVLNNYVHAGSKPIDRPSLQPKLRVGLAWSGRQDNPLNRKRSCPFAALAPLFDVHNVTFVNLQLDYQDQVDARIIDLTDQIHDFEDTAAIMANLDLIISIDTSVAHLAAASGIPTWVLLSHIADWRWIINRGSSQWYPGIHIFRQPDHGDWDSVIQEVAYRLSQLTGNDMSWHCRISSSPTCGGHSMERQLLEQQLVIHQEIMRLNASSPDAHLDEGASLALLGRYDEAVTSFRRVLELSLNHIAGHLNLAYSLLALGEYYEGWQHFEWRLRRIPTGQLPPWPMLRREQLGTDPSGTSVLVHCEQGYGDTIMFSRFIPLLEDAGYRVIVNCQPPLASLLTSVVGVNEIVLHGELLPRCDYQVLLLSLPHLFSISLETLPASIPYLSAQEQCIDTWKIRIERNLQ